MRLWHKDLIPYLPRQQLLGQWRECCPYSGKDDCKQRVMREACELLGKYKEEVDRRANQ